MSINSDILYSYFTLSDEHFLFAISLTKANACSMLGAELERLHSRAPFMTLVSVCRFHLNRLQTFLIYNSVFLLRNEALAREPSVRIFAKPLTFSTCCVFFIELREYFYMTPIKKSR